MIKNILSLFPNAILFQSKPDQSLTSDHFLFYDHHQEEWMAIPKKELNLKEIQILKAIYEQYEPLSEVQLTHSLSPEAISWYEFLFHNGQPPADGPESYTRFIQFHLNGNEIDKSEIESALKGLFSEKIIIIWENEHDGTVIENFHHKLIPLFEKELNLMTKTLESDFFIQISFFYGKQHFFSNQLPFLFHEEKEYFTFAQKKSGAGNVFSFERVFPEYMAFDLSESIKGRLTKAVVEVFMEDPEMFSTIKVFLESNLNASSTAKKLYIHRNTLQYRLDKFTEKTGIQLKDFYGAFTVFLACLIYNPEEKN